jgi:hypothetical protein
VLSHLALVLSCTVYTVLGAWAFQMLEGQNLVDQKNKHVYPPK